MVTIKTNNQPRELMSGLTLELYVGETKAKAIRDDFSYLNDEEFENQMFVTYRDSTYCLDQFLRNDANSDSPLSGWDGVCSDSYFSGVLLKYVEDSEYGEVIMGRYSS